jgi:hypothetical protein
MKQGLNFTSYYVCASCVPTFVPVPHDTQHSTAVSHASLTRVLLSAFRLLGLESM